MLSFIGLKRIILLVLWLAHTAQGDTGVHNLQGCILPGIFRNCTCFYPWWLCCYNELALALAFVFTQRQIGFILCVYTLTPPPPRILGRCQTTDHRGDSTFIVRTKRDWPACMRSPHGANEPHGDGVAESRAVGSELEPLLSIDLSQGYTVFPIW